MKKGNLKELASRQIGYFLISQAIHVGYAAKVSSAQCQSGRWLRIDTGLYRLPGYPDTLESEFTRWCLWSRNQKDEIQAVVSHESALHYYGLINENPPQIHLAVPKGFRKKVPSEVVIHKADMDGVEFEDHDAFRVATGLQALRDVAEAWVDIGKLKEVVGKALGRGLVAEGELLGDKVLGPIVGSTGQAESSVNVAAEETNNPMLAKVVSPITPDNDMDISDTKFREETTSSGPVAGQACEAHSLATRLNEIEAKVERGFSRIELDLHEKISNSLRSDIKNLLAQDRKVGENIEWAELPQQRWGTIQHHNVIRYPLKMMGSTLRDRAYRNNESKQAAKGGGQINGQYTESTKASGFHMTPVGKEEKPSAIMRRRGMAAFTLVELLVVITIISILASLLLPVIKNARDAAFNCACQNNQKQVFLSLAGYAGDFRGWTCQAYSYDDNKAWNRRLDLLGYSDNQAPTRDTETDQASIYVCPNYYPYGKWVHFFHTYAFPRIDQRTTYFRMLRSPVQYYQPDIPHTGSFGSWANPASALLLCDSRWGTSDKQAYYFEYRAASVSTDKRIHIRHSGRANSTFADGHVAGVAEGNIYPDYHIQACFAEDGSYIVLTP